jgi:4-aminobutyrate aminotransferase-like enzyme
MRMLAEGDYETQVAEKGAYFLAGLKELQSRWPQIGDVDGLGLALRAEICQADGWTPNKALLDQMAEEGMKADLEVDGQRYGLILDVGGYHKNVITLAPSLHISHAEIDLALKLLDQLLQRCTRG